MSAADGGGRSGGPLGGRVDGDVERLAGRGLQQVQLSGLGGEGHAELGLPAPIVLDVEDLPVRLARGAGADRGADGNKP